MISVYVKIISSLIFIVLCFTIDITYSFDDIVTHPIITSQAARNSNINNYIINIVGMPDGLNELLTDYAYLLFPLKKTILQLLQQGATDEDDPMCRASNHFHDPTKAWNQSYMADAPLWINAYCSNWTHYSNITWATGYVSRGGAPIVRDRQDMGFDNAKNYFYTALTSAVNNDREKYLVKTFRALGQSLHLLQDMAVPAHVRNDFQSHLSFNGVQSVNPTRWFSNPFEHYVSKNNALVVAAIPEIPEFQTPMVTDFWDTAQVGAIRGLAEITSVNYFSNETIPNNGTTPEHTFASPQLTSGGCYICTDHIPGAKEPTKYISRKACPTDGSSVDHFAAFSLMNSEAETKCEGIQTKKVWLDNNVHNTYAKELLPLAVGYSSALLDYFFRGTIELSLPAQGVYAIAAPDSTFNEIRVKAKNTTATGEEMSNGEIQLVVKYDLALSDPFQSVAVDVAPTTYIAVPEKNGVTTISKTTPTELVFDLSTNPIPLWATDVYIQVIYKGPLGNEINSVAAGFKDISEPTPIDVANNMDLSCINGNYMIAGSDEAISASDTNNDGIADWDVFPHGLTNVYLAFNGYAASPTNYIAKFASIPPGNYGRVFVLADYTVTNPALYVSSKVTVQKLDLIRDSWSAESFTVPVYARDAINNQDYYPILDTERGLENWFFIHYENTNGLACDSKNASPLTTAPVAVTL